MVGKTLLRPLTDTLTDAEISAANKVLHAHGLTPLEPGERLFDALNRLSYCDTTTYTDGATQLRKAIENVR